MTWHTLCVFAPDQEFFADIYAEAVRARPSPAHRALAALAAAGKLARHYTLNIDGLAAAVGLTTWHPEDNPDGACQGLALGYMRVSGLVCRVYPPAAHP